MPSAFWIQEDEQNFRATLHTQGPWYPQFQHGGPPAALLVRQMEQCAPRPGMILARVIIDILGPLPLDVLHATARVVRPGRKVALVEASLEYGGRTMMRASGWHIQRPSVHPPDAVEAGEVPRGPEHVAEMPTSAEWQCGFISATEWRFVRGDLTTPGNALVWIRPRYPLIGGEAMSPAQRLLLCVDSANGVSSPLDIRSWQFVPPELTVHCLRPPVGEWICLDASTHLQAEGIGLATADLYDEHGLVGRSAQALFIEARETSDG